MCTDLQEKKYSTAGITWTQMIKGSSIYAAWEDSYLQRFGLKLFGCEFNQRGKLSGEKSRSVEVFRSVYCKFLEQGLLFWVCMVPCTMGVWSWLIHQSITVMQIKFYSQYDSQLGLSAASSLSIGFKVVELLDHDHRTTKIKDDDRRHWRNVNITKSYCQWSWYNVSVPEEWNGSGLWSLSLLSLSPTLLKQSNHRLFTSW